MRSHVRIASYSCKYATEGKIEKQIRELKAAKACTHTHVCKCKKVVLARLEDVKLCETSKVTRLVNKTRTGARCVHHSLLLHLFLRSYLHESTKFIFFFSSSAARNSEKLIGHALAKDAADQRKCH